MGFTDKSLSIIEPLLTEDVKTVCELGDQWDFRHEVVITNPKVYPFISEWYKSKGVEYTSIDLNGNNDSKQWDLDQPFKTTKKFDLVTDLGVSEHVHDHYQCFSNVDKITKVGGIMVHENPKTGNWPDHGLFYVDTDFYKKLAEAAGYELLKLEEHPAMGNTKDGWNIIAVLKKVKKDFITREQFPKAKDE